MSKRSLPQTYVEDEDEAQTLIVTLRDATLGVTLELAYTIYRDRPVITRSARLINHSEQAVDLEKVASMQMDLPTQPLDAISLPGSYARERQLSRERLHRGVLLRQVLVLKQLAVYPNSFGVIPVNVIFNSED